MINNKDLPAYPINYGKSHDGTLYNSFDEGYGGLTKREKIAAMCLQGLLSMSPARTIHKQGLVQMAVDYTDTLLTHLSNTEK